MNKKKFQIDWNSTISKIKESEKSGGSSFKDERLYYPQFDEKGIAQAIIRFLPNPAEGEIPFVMTYGHSVKSVGGWYIENCPTTIKRECPVCKANSAIWDSDPDTARSRSRKKSFFANVLVVKDPLNPANEGKVYLFRYGKKVHEKIMEKIQPPEGGIDEPVMIFDYYTGADFKLIIKKTKVGTQLMPNYDSCKFSDPSLIGDDQFIEKIHSSLYKLTEFTAESNFKSYEDLEAKFNRVVGVSNPQQSRTEDKPETVKAPVKEAAKTPVKEAAKTVTAPLTQEAAPAATTSLFEGDSDDFFKSLKDEE